MQFTAFTAPHMTRASSVRFIMSMVLVALLPAAALHTYFFGPGVLVQFLLAATSGLACEALKRGKPTLISGMAARW
jgi:electron transport complex protein RnfD